MADALLQVENFQENLKQLLLYNASLIIDVNDEVEALYNDLSPIKAFLKDFAARRNKYEILKELERQIRSVANEAEDAIDTYIVLARSDDEKALHVFDYPSKLGSVAKQLESITAKLKDIYDQKTFGFEALQLGDSSYKRAKNFQVPIIEEDNLVGFGNEANILIDRLIGGSKGFEVISIIGMPGLGKTTLAKKLYKDPIIVHTFDVRAWVNVSQDYSRKELLLTILSNVTQITEAMSHMTAESLADELYKRLKGLKYLIVLDDVWSTEAWNDLKIAFPVDKKGSKVLLTSRIKTVAIHANPDSPPHCLRFLTEEESWELLQKRIFGKERCPPELEQIGKLIARKCEGLPLAIAAISGILCKGLEIDLWQKVAKSLKTYTSSNGAMDILALSYDQLPYHLKPCFLYLAVFPEDFEIPVWALVRLWIAEGFIQQDGEQSLEDTSENYLMELVERSLVLVAQKRSNGRIKTCRIHELVHDFCTKQAAEENFLHNVKELESSSLPLNPTQNNHRRLYIHSHVLPFISSQPSGPHVRSFLSFISEDSTLPLEQTSFIPQAFKLLRVLDVRSLTFLHFPDDLIQLVHLRYIALSGNFKVLPASIGNLWNIQTLIVETMSPELEILADLWKLIQLRHLHTNASTHLHGQKGKGPLVNGKIQTLSSIAPESCTEDVLAGTPNLKKLGICGKLASLAQSSRLDVLTQLEDLKLLNNEVDNPLSGLPHIPPYLKLLTLSNTLLDWKHMAVLGKLPNLEALKLKDNAFKGEKWETQDGEFPRLKVLQIEKIDLKYWVASSDHFPVLRSIVLKQCVNLEEIPSSMVDVVTLQNMELYWPTSSAANSAKQIQQERQDLGDDLKLLIYPPEV